MILVSLLVAAFLAVSVPALAQPETGSAAAQQLTETEAAAVLVDAGQLEDAKRVLAHVLETHPDDNEAHFLRGMIAVAEKRYDDAIADFRFILAAEPNRERVRLELARAFFLAADYENAERNFRFARSGDLSPEVKANIDRFLAAILRLKRWSYDVGLALAQDTNVNGATSVNQVDLYGLPFTLSDNARRKSGAGVAIDAGGEWSPLLADDVKGKLGGRVHRLEYGGSQFDDMTLSAYSGPEFLLPRWQIDTLITGFRRWYGNTPYNQGVGGRAAVTFALLTGLQLGSAFDMQAVSYRLVKEQDGPVASGNVDATYTISPSSLVRLAGGIGVQGAKLRALANTTRWIALDFYQDLPWGFSANIEPAFSWTRYDAPLAAFGVTRDDHLWAARLDLLNRRIEYRGFAPRLSFIYTNQSSTISLYRYSRMQLQVGLTRQF
ncbi:MAG TPA: surface lipoprotein assembly modifier [Micropepsaceae bacterium]|nr:surface lipoprotein assembly modifier [Micropepsaceae bacterium]